MSAIESGRFQEIDEDFVIRQVVKAMLLIGYYTEEFWQRELAMPVEEGESAPSGIPAESTHPLEPVEIPPLPPESGDVVIDVTMNGENDDRLVGGSDESERGEQSGSHDPAIREPWGASNALATHEPTSPEPIDNGLTPGDQAIGGLSKEKQQTIRLDGTVVAEPNFHKTSKGVDRIIFPLSVGAETHIITSSQQRAIDIHELALQPGEEVHVAGVPQNFTRTVNGELQTQQLIYAWAARRREIGVSG